MKKVIFFDADGTLWYPRKTKYNQHPVWVYRKYSKIERARKEFMLIPGAINTLKKLKSRGILLVVLSTNPNPIRKANILIRGSVSHFNLANLFDEVHATRTYHESKGEYILKLLKKYNLKKKDALMVGDSYEWDYRSAKNIGVDALLIKRNYPIFHPQTKKVKNTITHIKEILGYIE